MMIMNLFGDSPPSVNEKVAKLRLHLRRRSLGELERREIVEYDSDENVVKQGLRFSEVWADLREQTRRKR